MTVYHNTQQGRGWVNFSPIVFYSKGGNIIPQEDIAWHTTKNLKKIMTLS